jgi:hypothetical protein
MSVGEAEIRFPPYFFGERFSTHDTRSIRVLIAAMGRINESAVGIFP